MEMIRCWLYSHWFKLAGYTNYIGRKLHIASKAHKRNLYNQWFCLDVLRFADGYYVLFITHSIRLLALLKTHLDRSLCDQGRVSADVRLLWCCRPFSFANSKFYLLNLWHLRSLNKRDPRSLQPPRRYCFQLPDVLQTSLLRNVSL